MTNPVKWVSKIPLPLRQNISLVLFGLCLTIFLLEIGLRLAGGTILFFMELRNRVTSEQQHAYKILCLGESTTAGGYPQVLEEILNQKSRYTTFRVINGGIPSITTAHILLQLKADLKKYKPQMVVAMMGINDGITTVRYEDDLTTKVSLFFQSFRVYKLVKLLYERIRERNKTIGLHNYELGEGYYREGKYLEAQEMYQEAIKTYPKNYLPYPKLIKLYRDKGEYEKAEEIYRRVKNTFDIMDAELYLSLLREAYDTDTSKPNEQKVRDLRRSIKVNPENAIALAALARVYFRMGKFKQSETLYNKVVEINPCDYALHRDIIPWYFDTGRPEKAKQLYERMLLLHPQYDAAYSGLSFYYQTKGQQRLAKQYSEKAEKIRLASYNSATQHNYNKLKDILQAQGIRLVAMQYPVRNIETLKKMLGLQKNITFVDNEMVFKKALESKKYEELFVDRFATDFGHMSLEGQRLLGENLARTILSIVEENTYDFLDKLPSAGAFVDYGSGNVQRAEWQSNAWIFQDNPVDWNRISVLPGLFQGKRRDCIWFHPLEKGIKALHYKNVMIGERIDLFGGIIDSGISAGGGAPVSLSVQIDGKPVGNFKFQDFDSLAYHTIDTKLFQGGSREIVLQVQTPSQGARHFCFDAWIKARAQLSK